MEKLTLPWRRTRLSYDYALVFLPRRRKKMNRRTSDSDANENDDVASVLHDHVHSPSLSLRLTVSRSYSSLYDSKYQYEYVDLRCSHWEWICDISWIFPVPSLFPCLYWLWSSALSLPVTTWNGDAFFQQLSLRFEISIPPFHPRISRG